MVFWILFTLILVLLLYSYKVHFLNGQLLEIKKIIKEPNTIKKTRCVCTFKGTFFFKAGEYDIFENENFIVLIKNYNLLNNIIQNLFPENYIIVFNELYVDENLKSNFLKYIKATDKKNTDQHIKIEGFLHTKSVFNNSFQFERNVEVTIQ